MTFTTAGFLYQMYCLNSFFSYTKINQGYLLVKPLYIDRKGSFKGFTPQPDLKWVCGSQCKMS